MTTGQAEPAPMVTAGSRVRMHLRLCLPDGFQIESTDDGEPLQWTVGDGTLAEGLERTVLGLTAGDRLEVTLEPGAAFGNWDPDRIHRLPLSDVPEPDLLAVDAVIAFETPAGDEIAGRVLAVEPSYVEVDFNHPLARARVSMQAEILSVETLGQTMR